MASIKSLVLFIALLKQLRNFIYSSKLFCVVPIASGVEKKEFLFNLETGKILGAFTADGSVAKFRSFIMILDKTDPLQNKNTGLQ